MTSSIDSRAEPAARAASPPQSAVRQWVALLGLASMLVALAAMKVFQPADPTIGLLILFAAFSVPIIAVERLLARGRPVAAAARDDPERPVRVVTKLIGLAGTFAVIALAYWALPVYRSGQVEVLFATLEHIVWPAIAIAPLYVWFADRHMAEPRDSLYMAGRAMLGRWAEVDRTVLGQYALGWLVKAYFLPVMIAWAAGDLKWFLDGDIGAMLAGDEIGWYDLSWRLLILVDLLVASAGYLLTIRWLDAQIRSTEPTTFGWLVCLLCYPPFWGLTSQNYLAYDDDLYWGHWLAGVPMLKQGWGGVIIALMLIYTWATVSFGIRFSNLTHRGILTNGPYRWSRHPAYLTKNLSYWLISIPFVVHAGAAESLRQCLLLGGVNLIYYWRAKTEERHLSRDPVYRAYSDWIEEHGLIARLKRTLLLLGGRLATLLSPPEPSRSKGPDVPER